MTGFKDGSQTAVSSGTQESWVPRLTWLLVFLLVARIILMIFAPHQDPSEARYAEISRKMVETGDWIIPQHLYGVPFWAKPPLSMWLSAGGMKIFGVNEFGSRILIFASALWILWMVHRFAFREISRPASTAAAAFLMGMPIFFYCSAAVMTDMALVMGTTLAMVSFWNAIQLMDRISGYLFFVGLALGMLAKGPLALVLCVVPIAAWVVITRRWYSAFKRVPWLLGGLLFFILSAPWYIAAEKKTPGFLDYFLIGEHWKRFVEKGWEGDLYGNAHAEVPGTIWVFAVMALFPWVIALLVIGWRQRKNVSSLAKDKNHFVLYLILWAIWPLVFFTPARNIISTYVLPSLPAFALLLAVALQRMKWDSRFTPAHPVLIGALALLVAGTMLMMLAFPSSSPKHTEKNLVADYSEMAGFGEPLVYYNKRRYSAEFYSRGRVELALTIDELRAIMARPSMAWVAIRPKDFYSIPEDLRSRLSLMDSWGDADHHILYRETR